MAARACAAALLTLQLGLWLLSHGCASGPTQAPSQHRQHRASEHQHEHRPHASPAAGRFSASQTGAQGGWHLHYPHARHNHSSPRQPARRGAAARLVATSSAVGALSSLLHRGLADLALEPSARESLGRSAKEHSHKQPRTDSYAVVYPVAGAAATPASAYPQHRPGRRVCSSRITEATSSPAQQQEDRQARFVYGDAQGSQLFCCPGWTQVTRWSSGCNKPVCSLPCHNGGVCSSPGRCTCPKGFSGNYCQTDVDECVTEKPCDQICKNVPGSYECYCRNGYVLQPDGQSCRKNGSDGTALEARDLVEDFQEITTTTTRRPILHMPEENDVNSSANSREELLRRLIKLEKQLAKGWKTEIETNEIVARISLAIDSINEIKSSLRNMQSMQQEVYELRNKVKLYDFETRRIQYLTDRVIDLENRIRLRCRSNIYLNHGSP